MKRLGYLAAIGLFLVVAGAAFAACGDDDNGDDGDATTAPTAAATTARTAAATPAVTAAADTPEAGGGAPTSAAGATTLNVVAQDFSFEIDMDAIPAGGTINVSFTNEGSAPHTVTFYTDEDFTQPVSGGDSGNVSGGGSKDFTFTAPSSGDELYYRCEIHPTQMQGELSLQ